MMTTPRTLDDLLRAIQRGEQELTTDLPTFGGTAPRDTSGIWSWDAERLLIGSCADDLAIETRGRYIEARCRYAGVPAAGQLVLCESPDGWSLHAPGSTDQEIAEGDAPYLLDGPGEVTQADYDRAWQIYADRVL